MSLRLTAVGFAALLLSSCFAVTDLDRFHRKEPEVVNFLGLKFTVRGMVSHVAERFEYRVIDNSSNIVQFVGITLGVSGPEATTTFTTPGAIPKNGAEHRLDFFADHDNSGDYNSTVEQVIDHSWRQILSGGSEDGVVNYVFDHNTSFSYLNEPKVFSVGAAALLQFKNLQAANIGQRIEVRIADASTNRMVGLGRVAKISLDNYNITLPGIIERDVAYKIEVYMDDTQGGAARHWVSQVTGEAQGLTFNFAPDAAPPTEGVGPFGPP